MTKIIIFASLMLAKPVMAQNNFFKSFYQKLTGTKSKPLNDEQRLEKVTKKFNSFKAKFPTDTISAEAAKAAHAQYLFVDAREPEEQAVSMIPGAVSAKELKENFKQYKDKQIITYCTVGYRSGKLATELKKQGFSVKNMIGGILAWTHAQGKLEHLAKETKKVHVWSSSMAPLTHTQYQPVH